MRICVIMILILNFSIARSQTQNEAILITKGVKSPYDGILMPEEHYRYLTTRELEADNLNQYISNPSNKLSDHSTPWGWFLTFFVLGLGGGIFVSK
jgi:hypothetical protein